MCSAQTCLILEIRGHLHFLVVLVREVEEPGDVKAQLGHVLEAEEHQTYAVQTTQDKGQKSASTRDVEESASGYVLLTSTNTLQRRAAGTGRCTAAAEKSPPGKEKNSFTRKGIGFETSGTFCSFSICLTTHTGLI